MNKENFAFAEYYMTFNDGSFKAHKRYPFKWSFDTITNHQIVIVTTEEKTEHIFTWEEFTSFFFYQF